jgi:glycerol dehydrogenase
MQRFCHSVGLPVTLRQLNVEPTPANIDVITSRVVDPGSGITAEPFPVTAEAVRAAIVVADTLGEEFLSSEH